MSYYFWLGAEAPEEVSRELLRHAAYFDGKIMRDYFTREPLSPTTLAYLENNQE